MSKFSEMSDYKKYLLNEVGHINLKVVRNNKILSFKMRKDAPMKKLMNTYCSKEGININLVRFLHEGNRVHEWSTPMSLKMEEGDVLEIFQGQGVVEEPNQIPDEPENITIKIFGNNKYVPFKMRKDKELQKIMIDYCYRENLDRNITRFLYDEQRVFEYQTPAELDMKDDAVLEVFLRMDGGRIL